MKSHVLFVLATALLAAAFAFASAEPFAPRQTWMKQNTVASNTC